jgi:hypothetical protein
MVEHQPFAYLSFVIYVQEKEQTDCTGLEKYVKEELASNQNGFMPKPSYSYDSE